MKRLQTDVSEAANADNISAFGIGGLQDTAEHFSLDDAAPVSVDGLIGGPDGEAANGGPAADAAGSVALEPASDVFASLTKPAAEPADADDDDGSGSGDISSDLSQQDIDGIRLADTGLSAGYAPAQGDSPFPIPVLNPPAGFSAGSNIFSAVGNSPQPPPAIWIGDAGGGANSAQGHEPSIGALPSHGGNGPGSVIDNPGTIGPSQPGPAADSPVASANSGINVSQVTTNADGSITETVTFAGSGIVFNNTFDPSVTQAYKNCALAAEQTIASEWTNSVTINEEFSAQAAGQSGFLASNSFYVFGVSYATLKSALTTLASQEPNDSYLQQAVAHLPASDPSAGAGFELSLPYARMLGLTSSSQHPDDIVTLNTSYNWSYGQDVINTVEHEISEGGMGRIGGLGDQNGFWSIMDLFRYNSSGALDESDGRDGRTTYFSYNGGATLSSLAFNNEYSGGVKVNGGDTADFVQQDVFGTGNPGEINALSQTDLQLMEALGWRPPGQGPVVTAANTALGPGPASVAASTLFTAADLNGETITTYGFTDTGPGHFILNGSQEPNNQEIDVTAVQLSQLIYQSVPGSIDTLQVRAEDATAWGNWTTFTVSGPPLVIQTDTGTYGSTSLIETANQYYLDNSVGFGPALKYYGANVTTGQFGGWTPIGAVQTASGYEIAWDIPGTNQYGVWNTDSNGNFTAIVIGDVPGSSYTLESIESTFHQDLNGDGTIGPTKSVIATDGSTSLTQLADEYFLDPTGGSGPVLKDNGAPVVAGEFGGWTPIGAVQTASGYEIAWDIPGTNQYGVWNTDSNGNFTAIVIGDVPGNSYALESIESTFHQDLNGDGMIGPIKTVIATDGSTSLTQLANEYFLDPTGGSGPALEDNGAPVVTGEFGSWTPIGAVQTASGYEIAWDIPGANQYGVWNTDSNGNFTAIVIGDVPGNSPTLEALEPVFDQNLNGDGQLTTTVIATDGSTSLTEVADQVSAVYYLNSTSGPGPALKDNGTDVLAGEFGGWTPIGAVQTAGGYEVAWDIPGTDQYGVWNTDSNGNFTSIVIGDLPGNSIGLESIESIFHQDLNGDRVIGLYAPNGGSLQINSALSGPSGAATVGTGATLELAAADSSSVTFASATGKLQLDTPSTFTGQIFNFSGNGSLSGSDQIDLKGVNYTTVQDSYAGGVLTVSDGAQTVHINFSGSYTLANFKFASDGNGGTIVYDPPVPGPNGPASSGHDGPSNEPRPGSAVSGSNTTLIANTDNDTFVFPSNLWHATTTGSTSGIDTSHFDHATIGNDPAALARAHDSIASFLIADASHDTIVLPDIGPAHVHDVGFHLV